MPRNGEPALALAVLADRGGAVAPTVTSIVATVDSGASRSFLPMEIATRLGLTGADLTKDPGLAEGVGSQFETWSSTVRFTGPSHRIPVACARTAAAAADVGAAD
jgi:hypothetical protein